MAVGLIVWSLGALARYPEYEVSDVVGARDLREALVRWTTRARPPDIRLALSAAPNATTRSWAGALAATGSHVSWAPVGSTPLVGSAITVEPVPDPAGRVRVAVAAPSGSRVVQGDELGPIDTITASGGGVTVEGPSPVGMASGAVDGTVARAEVGDSLLFRHLLVLGRVSWESKFLVRALEDEGWNVDLRLTLTPQTRVTEGVSLPLDTGRVAAVLVVGEPTGIDEAALSRYVHAGGGLVLLDGAEGKLPRLAVGDTSPAPPAPEPPSAAIGGVPPSAVTLASIATLRAGAVAIDRRGGRIAVAVRRLGAGRVEQVGYRDTWRWRLAGGDSGMGAHRRWWASRVSDVAYAPAIHQLPPVDADPAPLAAWIDRFGPPTPSVRSWRSAVRHPPLAWLFAVLLITLVAEWASRRLRGEG